MSIVLAKETQNMDMRNRILYHEFKMLKEEGTLVGDTDVAPVKHTFSDKMYIREIFIPAGRELVGKIHRHDHPNFLLSGAVQVATEGGGIETLIGPMSMISPAGTKRVVKTISDTTWVTVHHNPDNITDLKKLEEMIIAKNYLEYEEGRKLLEHKKNTQITNCGLTALRNISDLKNISVRTLVNIAEDNGISLTAYKVPQDKVSSIELPAVVHSEDHFSYIASKEDFADLNYSGVVLYDREVAYEKIDAKELSFIKGATWVAAIAASVAGTVGAVQYMKGRKMAKQNKRPDYEIPQEIKDNLSQAQMQALEGLPPEQKQQYVENVQRGQNFGLNALGDRKAGISGLATLTQQGNDAYKDLMTQDAIARQANLDKLMGAREQIAQYKDKGFELNKLIPYQEKAQAAAAMQSAGLQNIAGSTQSGSSAIGQGIQANKDKPRSEDGERKMSPNSGGIQNPSGMGGLNDLGNQSDGQQFMAAQQRGYKGNFDQWKLDKMKYSSV